MLLTSIAATGRAIAQERALVAAVATRSEALLGDDLPPIDQVVAPPAFGVVGTVVAVSPGVGLWWEDGPDGPKPRVVDVDDPSVDVFTVDLTIQVELPAFGSAPDSGDMVTAGLVIDTSDPSVARQVFLGERLFAVLDPSDPLWDFDPDLVGIALEGTMLAGIAGGGELDWFLAPAEFVEELGLDRQTVSQLASVARS